MKVGFVGWRGMVGSVLMQRMKEENDFAHIPEAFFFTTSNVGGAAPDFGQAAKTLLDANDVAKLAKMDIIVTCQGGDYTKYPCSNPCATAAGTDTGLTRLLPCA